MITRGRKRKEILTEKEVELSDTEEVKKKKKVKIFEDNDENDDKGDIEENVEKERDKEEKEIKFSLLKLFNPLEEEPFEQEEIEDDNKDIFDKISSKIEKDEPTLNKILSSNISTKQKKELINMYQAGNTQDIIQMRVHILEDLEVVNLDMFIYPIKN